MNGVAKAVGQQVVSEVQKTVYTAENQLGLKADAQPSTEAGIEQVAQGQAQQTVPTLPVKPNPYDSLEYRAQLEEETQQKLAVLRRRMQEIQNEISGAGMVRQQEQTQYNESQQAMMNQMNPGEKTNQEGAPIIPVEPPASVKARRGTGEVSKKSFKG